MKITAKGTLEVEGYAGIWVNSDPLGINVLIRVKYARGCPERKQIELVGDIVRMGSLEREGVLIDPGEAYTIERSFPMVVKMKLPDRGVLLTVVRVTCGRPNRESSYIPIVIRGRRRLE